MTTPEWRAIDDASPLFEYSGNWQASTNVNPASAGWRDIWSGTYHSTTQSKSIFFVQFHGDGFDFWSHVSVGNNGQYVLQLDGGTPETVTLNNAEPNPRLPIWQKSGLTLCDHEVTGVFMSGTGAEMSIGYLDSFAIHNSQFATDGFDLKSVGPAARDVPSNAIVVDNEDSTISYNGQWSHGNGIRFYQQTTASTTTPGDSFTFHFTGTAIWYYTDLDSGHAPVSISIDGGTADVAQSTPTTGTAFSRRMIWWKQGLSNTLHTLTATHVGTAGRSISLDFFRVLGSASAAPPPNSGNSGNNGNSASTTTNGPVSNGPQVTTTIGGIATTINRSSLVTISGTLQAVSGSPNSTTTDDPFKATIIIAGASTGTSSNQAQTTGDGTAVPGIGEQQQQSPSNNIGVIIGSAFGAAALVIFAVGCLLWYRRKSKLDASLTSNPLHSPELDDSSRLESAISAKRDRFLASEPPQPSSPPARDMEERAGRSGPASSNSALVPIRGADSPPRNAPSIAASHSQRSTSVESLRELYIPLSPAPPPYER